MTSVSVVITACGRPDLLRRTIETFLEFNTYPIAEFIVSEDSGIPDVNKGVIATYPTFTWIAVETRQGQIKSIDAAYALVKTPYVFHLEDDWESYRSGCIEESLAILETTPNISAVMCRNHDPRVYHLSSTPPILDCWGQWGYFSLNPGLRRMDDYKGLFNGSYNSFVQYDSTDPLGGEYALNQLYRKKGFRMALTPHPDGYLRHIGDGRHVGTTLSPPLKIGLCMIVKNESHIIKESMGCTLPFVDTYCIVDTGSTDDTIQVIKDFYAAKGIEGHVHERPWQDFGTNRSEALALCDGKMDYILVIDADDLMSYPDDGPAKLRTLLRESTPNSATIRIKQGLLDYARGQIFKANDGWKYKGVLHEYPANDKPNNKSIELPREFWMESRRLGARNLTGDKPQRDIAVLLKGTEDEPDNERYAFYLAQSYHDIGDFANSLKWYKKRFTMQRWAEEAWYSAYRVGNCYKQLGNIPKFECWMLKAHAYRPERAEPIYQLAEYFRIHGQHYKAYHYIQLGRRIAYPSDVLFIEGYPYRGGFDYEASIIDYYVQSDKKIGMRSCVQSLLKQGLHAQNVLSNIQFYAQPIPSTITVLAIPKVFGADFRPTAVSVSVAPFANVRFVNYMPPADGNYKTRTGEAVQTRNAYMNLTTGEVIAKMDDSGVRDLDVPSNVKGIEDVRLFTRNGVQRFLGCYYDVDINVRMLEGEYDVDAKAFKECRTIHSPFNRKFEKNWLPIPQTDLFLYDWHPLRIGTIVDGKMTFPIVVETPPLFELFRGSTPPRMREGKLWTMVHMAEYSNPRKYYHLFVEMDAVTYKPLRVSLPFVFKSVGIEYCISMRFINDGMIECYSTFTDSTPSKVKIDVKDIEWIDVSV
jgi:glycosyltransferase involved in cell wall biosynthesis